MSDSYVECLVKAKQPTWAKILKVLLIALTVNKGYHYAQHKGRLLFMTLHRHSCRWHWQRGWELIS